MKRILCCVLLVALLFCSAACVQAEEDTAEILNSLMELSEEQRAEVLKYLVCAMYMMGERKAVTKAYGVSSEMEKTAGQELLEEDVKQAVGTQVASEKLIYEGTGFDTPEEAALNYLEGLKELNLQKMLSSFAYESYIGHLSMESEIVGNGMYNVFLIDPCLPLSNDLFADLSVERYRSSIVLNILWQMLRLNFPGTELENQKHIIANDEGFERLREIFSGDIVEQITEISEVEAIAMLDMMDMGYISSNYFSTQAIQLRIAHAVRIGADDLQDVAIRFRLNGKTYFFCPRAICYNGRWYLYTLDSDASAFCGAESTMGGMFAVDEEE